MGKVVSHMTMSLDGFIADPHDGVAELLRWYQAGTVTVASAANAGRSPSMNAARRCCGKPWPPPAPWYAARACSTTPTAGMTGTRSAPGGRGDPLLPSRTPPERPANGRPSPSPAAWRAELPRQADRRDKDVAIASIAAQALDLGLVDEVTISLVPVLPGKGIPYFAHLARAPHRFDIRLSSPAAASPTCAMPYGVLETGPALPST